MKMRKKSTKTGTGILAAVMLALSWIWSAAFPVLAAAGNVYTCTVHPCYSHPVTGEIEDPGGEGSYATGQGMVDGVVYATGILELTDGGEYYLTVRFSLMDQTSGHSFWVQNVGDTGWAAPAIGVTGNGTDANGTTADICMQVPSENCVVRCSMYVEPMGRDVIFYLYPSDYTAGNSTDMNATMVSEASGSSAAAAAGGSGSAGVGSGVNSGAAGAGSGTNSGAADTGSGTNSGAADTGNGTNSAAAADTGNGTGSSAGSDAGQSGSPLQNSSGSSSSGSSDMESGDSSTEAPALSSSIDEAAQPTTSTDTELNDAQGLSLSTGADASEEAEETGSSGGSGVFAMGAAVTVSGLVLMGTAAVIVYFFRKNWKRWGGGYDDDE